VTPLPVYSGGDNGGTGRRGDEATKTDTLAGRGVGDEATKTDTNLYSDATNRLRGSSTLPDSESNVRKLATILDVPRPAAAEILKMCNGNLDKAMRFDRSEPDAFRAIVAKHK